MDLSEQARKDPRAGDKWQDRTWTVEVIPPDDDRVKLRWSDGATWRLLRKGFELHASKWTLLSRGPAPAVEKPERDPRIDPVFGDELKCTEGHTREVGEVGKNGQGYECVWYDQYTPGGNRYIREVCSLGEWREINRGAEILAYGDRPAPAAPSRDPCTQPVVGDEWQDDSEVRRKLIEIGSAAVEYRHSVFGLQGGTLEWWIGQCKKWTLHRKGDDPAWRPEGERSDAWHADPDGWRRVGWNANIHIDDSIIETLNMEWPTLGAFADAVSCDMELVNDTLTAVGRVAVLGGIWKFTEAGSPGNECPEAWKPGLRAAFLSELPAKPEPPAAGIKVGDRVRHHSGDEGVIESRDAYGVKVLYDDDDTPQTFSYRDVEHWLTIIPPAAPEPDDTGDEPPTPEPNFFREHGDDDAYESVHHPPHYGGDSPHEVIKFIEAHDLGFNAGNVVKYVVRAGRKPGEDKVKDLEKAVWYLNRIVAAAKGSK